MTLYSRLSILRSTVFSLALLPPIGYGQSSVGSNATSMGKPEFVLVGTSRIGSRYSATLQLQSGKQIIVVSEHGESVQLSGFDGYAVTSIEPRRVSILHSNDSVCVSISDPEAVCNAKTTALALKIRPFKQLVSQDSGQAVIHEANDLTDVPASPGSFIGRLQAQAARRRERPEVPDGMELIETSSGFQLVPDD